jgi:predicted CxxxxCH...CXXCH cytochrome family protein
MKSRALFAVILLAVLTAIPTMASAAGVHYFDCDLCHRTDATWNTIDGSFGVCITCHDAAGNAAFDFGSRTRPDDGHTSGVIPPGFASGDASNALGSNPGFGNQSSHAWGASDRNPAAGASPASSAMYNSRRGASNGFVSCYKCHDPHTLVDADYATGNEKMLRTAYLTDGDGTSTNSEENVEAMCTECHLDWASMVPADRGLKSHPMVADYGTFQTANSDRYKPFAANGEMALVGGTKVGCSTCHGLHNTDSDSATVDAAGTVGVGDGMLLKGDGASSASDATGTALCTSCHVYRSHPSSAGMEIGCLTCHSGHSYNDGTPNYYILRSEVTIPAGVNLPMAGQTVSGLRYLSATTTDAERDANFATYCNGCHGTLADITTSTGGSEDHTLAHDQCSLCHSHYDPGSPDKSFTVGGGGCTSCHGTPPRTTTAGGPDGYAVNGPIDYSTDSNFDETTTPHATHALLGSNPVMGVMSCSTCHTSYSANHNEGSFQSVLEVADTKPVLLQTGGLSALYAGAGSGTCTAVYCHSNGNLAAISTTSPNWDNGNDTISVGNSNACSACHDDATTNIGVAGKGNTAAHNRHVVTKGYSCNVCHDSTAIDGASVDVAAGKHINGNVELAYDTAYSLGVNDLTGTLASAASCNVYCHSNGDTNGTILYTDVAWSDTDDAGRCGACHEVAAGDANINTITGAALPDAHAKHIAQGIACTTCHTTNGTGVTHLDGEPSLTAGAADRSTCNVCHGSSNGGSGADAEPVWTSAVTVTCATCHTGADISVIGGGTGAGTYMDVAEFYTAGHGDAGLTGAPDCTGCHDAAAAGHFDGDNADRLIGGATANDAYCNTCHVSHNSHYSDAETGGGGSTDGNACNICHNPHGEGMGSNADVMLTIGTGFIDRTDPTDYFNAGNTGVCQVCHVKADGTSGINHYNQTDAPDGHNAAQVCTDCHKHTDPVAFEAGAGTNCGDCHAYDATSSYGRISSGAHLLHTTVDDGVIGNEDLTDCAQCHTGADTYTYAAGGTHMDGNVDVAVGYSDAGTDGDLTDDTCATACHGTAIGTAAFWEGPALGCGACHGDEKGTGTEIASGKHASHLAVTVDALDCNSCHQATIPTDTTHIGATGSDEGLTLVARATPVSNDAEILVTPWVDADNTCANAACHNPTGGAFLADWDSSTSSCVLCHDNAPATGAHAKHIINPGPDNTDAEDLSDCANCHTGAGSYGYAHRDGASAFIAGIADAGAAPAYTCSTACHSTTAGMAEIWNSNAIGCDACHDGRKSGDATTMSSVDHTNHLTVAGTTIDCNTCHQATIPADTVHASSPGATDGAKITNKATPVQNNAEVLVSTWNGSDTCSNINCHNPSPGESKAAVWGTSTASCNLCHADTTGDPNSGSHTEHINASATFNVTATCDNCHTVPGGAAFDHLDGTVSIDYTYDGTQTDFTNTTWGSCDTTTCHSDGENTPTAVQSPDWGTASADCTICHIAPPSSGDHLSHMSSGRVTDGMTCNSCHSGSASNSTTAGGSTHLAGGSYDVVQGGNYDITGSDFAVTLSYTQAPTSSCATANCHSSGGSRDWAVPTSCEGCHSDLVSDTTHAAHINLTGGIENDVTDCVQCHGAAVTNYIYAGTAEVAHQNGSTTFAAGIVIGGTSPNWTCANACHSEPAGVAALWSATSLSCDSCHGDAPADGGADGTAHADHLAAGVTCGTCHVRPAAGNTAHIDDYLGGDSEGVQLADRANALPNEATVIEASFNDGTDTCSTAACHDPSGTGFAAVWTVTTGSTSSCALCHVGTTGDPTTGSHTAHRTTPNNYTADIACIECHDDNGTNMAHRDGTVEVPLDGTIATSGDATAGGTTWNGTTCSATYCHNGSLIGGALGYSDPGAAVAPTWGDAAYLDGTQANDCNQCHDAPPNPAQGHQNNPSCVTCHDNTNGTHDGFVIAGNHVDGTLDTSGGNNCTDCHNAADIDDGLNGVHNSHTNTGFITGKTVSSGAYGGAGWYTTTYVAGQPVFGCGQCHNGSEGTSHPTSTVLNVDIDPAGETPGAGNVKLLNAAQSTPSYTTLVSVTCASVYCHSDASGSFKTTLDWYGGAFATDGTECASCHGNSPTTAAHGVHEVGIHYEELYNGSTGLMTDAGASNAAHGDAATSTTISCYTCHSETATGSANDQNTTCVTCHTGGAAKGNVAINAGFSTHINGIKDVKFANLSTFKSKAQLRDNLADADDGSNLLSAIWNRITGYKGATDYDTAQAAFATPVFTQGADTCSTVACHNGNTATWSDTSVDCMYCHTSLPK